MRNLPVLQIKDGLAVLAVLLLHVGGVEANVATGEASHARHCKRKENSEFIQFGNEVMSERGKIKWSKTNKKRKTNVRDPSCRWCHS